MMGILDYRTYNKYIDRTLIGEPVNGAYTLKQVVKIVYNYQDYFTEPLELTQSTANYSNHLQNVATLGSLV